MTDGVATKDKAAYNLEQAKLNIKKELGHPAYAAIDEAIAKIMAAKEQ